MASALFIHEPRVALVARDYQRKDHDESLRLWNSGERGVLTRVFTGGGKTPMACLKARTWLARGPNHRVLVVSYERDLVWQFAQEIDDFLGIIPGIEMGEDRVHPGDIPLVTVASRQSLLPAEAMTAEQARVLEAYGIDARGLSKRVCKRLVHALATGTDVDDVRDKVKSLRDIPEAHAAWSRLHKFDWRLNWLVFSDEAHRHAHNLKSVGHIADWFDQNPESKRNGLTATPKRGDGISIGHKMFPAVAIDFPLFHIERPCGISEGWAVPYVQKYIEVAGVDFKRIKQIAGDFDEADLERILGQEGTLAKLIEPLLDMVEDRRTLVFSPGIDMAANVALYINARSEAQCPQCHLRRWYPIKLIGDGAQCKCGALIDTAHITKAGEQAKSINGTTQPHDRKAAYTGHQAGEFQFLSVCGLCREGYNDPDISCVAVFRPVSKKASSLAEQMKGRSCRPCRSIMPVLHELLTAEERVEAIATSDKPNALIIDLVGITGLADCASTIQIYAEGLDDEVAELAANLLEQSGEETDVAEVVRRAKREVEAERARQQEAERQRLEEARVRAKADAEVRYSAHEVGSGSNVNQGGATSAQMNLIAFLGMDIRAPISRKKAGRIIGQLKAREDLSEVAYKNGIPLDQWTPVSPSDKQLWRLGQLGIHPEQVRSSYDASQIIGAWKNPREFEDKKGQEISSAADNDSLTAIAHDLLLVNRVLPADAWQRLVDAGKAKREALV